MSVEQEGPSVPRDAAERSPRQVRAAGVVVGLEALAALSVAAVVVVMLIVGRADRELPVGAVLGLAGLFLLFGGALAAVAAGLVRGRRWARTPAIVTQLLLLPVAYSLIGPSHQLAFGVVVGLLVAGCFLLLISEPARAWAAADWERPAR